MSSCEGGKEKPLDQCDKTRRIGKTRSPRTSTDRESLSLSEAGIKRSGKELFSRCEADP